MNGDEFRNRLGHEHRAQRRILVKNGHLAGNAARRQKAERPARDREHGAEVVVEVEVSHVPDDLWEVVLPCGGGNVSLFLNVQPCQAQGLVVVEGELSGFIQREPANGRTGHGWLGRLRACGDWRHERRYAEEDAKEDRFCDPCDRGGKGASMAQSLNRGFSGSGCGRPDALPRRTFGERVSW